MTVSAIIVAAGLGTRMTGDIRKQYLLLNGRPILSHTLRIFENCPAVDRIFLVVQAEDFDFCRTRILSSLKGRVNVTLVPGGAERQDSVYNGLVAAEHAGDDIVVIHDGVRPFVSCERLTACIAEAGASGACILGIPVVDTLKHVSPSGCIDQTIQREGIWRAQTPQAFRYRLIRQAHEDARKARWSATDDALLVERIGKKVKIVPGGMDNLKITTKEDLLLAEAIIRTQNNSGSPIENGQ